MEEMEKCVQDFSREGVGKARGERSRGAWEVDTKRVLIECDTSECVAVTGVSGCLLWIQ